MPQYIHLNPETADYKALRPVVEVLLAGGVVAGPTQSYYALMASADQATALAKIQAMKGRDSNKPFLLLLDRSERVLCYAREIPDTARGLIETFWPGPLTLLLRANSHLHGSLVGSRRTVGVRVEGLPLVRTLVRALDRAVTGTSANPGGEPPAVTPSEVEAYFGDQLDLIIDSGPCPGGQPSTLIDVSLGPPRLLRDGPLNLDEMIAAAPNLRT